MFDDCGGGDTARRQRQQSLAGRGTHGVIAASARPTPQVSYVRFIIRLGYPYAWQLETAISEELRRLCVEDSHKLQHCLRD
ncbi:hypothetical protein E2C01_049285 [Portunus trituberculatus]|uniref:Uncharacterized protein n=1 Tax=Portunus trituberculatus TaxID=210409 RepID=A0A5B7G909_PORTR|nr:hypothetical protein [Portunus trituberculatus]